MILIDGFMKGIKMLTVLLVNLICVVNLNAQSNLFNPINEPNKKYIINKTIDLRGQTIRIPSGCSLFFKNKGIIKNGTLIGDSSVISAENRLIFDHVVLKGTFASKKAYSEWFNIKSDCVLDENNKFVSGTNNLQSFRNLFLFNNVSIRKGCYMLEGTLGCKSYQVINGNNATLKFLTKNFCINIDGTATVPVTDVVIKNLTIVGCKQEYSDKTEWWHGINIGFSKNIKVENIVCDQCRGDGFYIGTRINKEKDERIPQNIILYRIKTTNNHRNGLSITRAKNADVVDSEFCYTSGTLPETGLDIEPNGIKIDKDSLIIGEVESITISNCRFWGNAKEGLLIANQRSIKPSMRIIENVQVSDCFFDDDDITISGCADSKLEKLTLKNSVVKVNGESLIRNLTLSNFKMEETEGGNNKTAIDLAYYRSKDWPVRSNIIICGMNIDGYNGGAIKVGQGDVIAYKKYDGLTISKCKITNCGKGIVIGKSVNNLRFAGNEVDGKEVKVENAEVPVWEMSLLLFPLILIAGGAWYVANSRNFKNRIVE